MILSQKGLNYDVCVPCKFACCMCAVKDDSCITAHPGELLKHTDVNQADIFPLAFTSHLFTSLLCGVPYQHVICHAVIVPPCFMLPMIAPAFGSSWPMSLFYLDSRCGFSLPLSGERRQFDFCSPAQTALLSSLV